MKVTTGMKKLDGILSGGFPENSTVLLSGGPGTGKTLVALRFLLEGARKGEKCCYVTLNETKDELLRACAPIASLSGIRGHLDKRIVIEHIPMSQSNVSMKRFVDIISRYPDIDRIVIDNVNKLLIFSESDKAFREYFVELISCLKKMKSSLLLCEIEDNERLDSCGIEAFECDGVVQILFLDLEEKPMRAIIVHKMRYTDFEPKVPHGLVINSKDVQVTDTKVI